MVRPTRSGLLNTYDAVLRETPAALATSLSVAIGHSFTIIDVDNSRSIFPCCLCCLLWSDPQCDRSSCGSIHNWRNE